MNYQGFTRGARNTILESNKRQLASDDALLRSNKIFLYANKNVYERDYLCKLKDIPLGMSFLVFITR